MVEIAKEPTQLSFFETGVDVGLKEKLKKNSIPCLEESSAATIGTSKRRKSLESMKRLRIPEKIFCKKSRRCW